MASKKNGKARHDSEVVIELDILNPEHFQTIGDVRSFVEDGAFGLMVYTLQMALLPDIDPRVRGFADKIVEDARGAAYYLADDLTKIARAAVRGGPVRAISADGDGYEGDRDRDDARRSLLFVSLSAYDGCPTEETREAVFAQLRPTQAAAR